MTPLRRLALLLCLAFALAIGQQAMLLHGMAHAVEKMAQKGDPKPATSACEQCALAAQPLGAPGAGLPPVAIAAGHVAALPAASTEAPPRPRIVFLSRAPPVLL
ncbi:MAG TPA: hypothetical protein VFK48_17575 [Usitatibacter sp.]|nr:hypothetical protein [Usitatibacter sp.]